VRQGHTILGRCLGRLPGLQYGRLHEYRCRALPTQYVMRTFRPAVWGFRSCPACWDTPSGSTSGPIGHRSVRVVPRAAGLCRLPPTREWLGTAHDGYLQVPSDHQRNHEGQVRQHSVVIQTARVAGLDSITSYVSHLRTLAHPPFTVLHSTARISDQHQQQSLW
jgi:hypothetical protein